MLPAPCAIFSDTHLGVATPETERALLSFVRHLRGRAASVVINGDLFDFWFEWRTVMPRTGYRVLAALADLAESGVPLVWIAGNHDCWGGDVLRDAGATYHVGAWRGTIGAWHTLIEHGDGLRPREDRGYRALRRVVRHPASAFAFRWLHPDVGSRLASGSSGASREWRARDAGRGLRTIAMDALAADPSLDLVVFGHSHVFSLERGPTGGAYANAGSWLARQTFLEVEERRVTLREWTGSAEGELLDALDRRPEEATA